MFAHRFEKRIKRDIDMIRGKYTLYKVKNDIHVFDDTFHYRIVVPSEYPFHCIDLYCVSRDKKHQEIYHRLYKPWVDFYTSRLPNLQLSQTCLCCHNLNRCWSPHNRMLHVMTEAKDFYAYFHKIRALYFGEKILNSINHLNNDSIQYILSYLYDS